MGRKVNPVGFRLGIVSDWESKWFAERNYTDQLHEDHQHPPADHEGADSRRVSRGSSSSVRPTRSMSRSTPRSQASSSASKARTSSGIRQMLEKSIGKKVHLKIEEIKVPEVDARLDRREHRRADRAPCFLSAGDEARGADRRCAVAPRASRFDSPVASVAQR